MHQTAVVVLDAHHLGAKRTTTTTEGSPRVGSVLASRSPHHGVAGDGTCDGLAGIQAVTYVRLFARAGSACLRATHADIGRLTADRSETGDGVRRSLALPPRTRRSVVASRRCAS